MANHFKSTTTYPGTLEARPNDIDGGKNMPSGCYHGFCLGPESDHDLVMVTAGGAPFLLGPGMVVPVPAIECVPELVLVRKVEAVTLEAGALQQGSPGRSIVHVIGLTEPHELAIRPRRAIRRYQFTLSHGAAGSVFAVFPFLRRHALLCIKSSAAGSTLDVRGMDRLPDPDIQALLLDEEVIPDGGSTDDCLAVHIGGTDHEEPFPELRLDIDGANANTFTCTLVMSGEMGD